MRQSTEAHEDVLSSFGQAEQVGDMKDRGHADEILDRVRFSHFQLTGSVRL